MHNTRDQVTAALFNAFPESDANELLTVLDEYGTESYEQERERVQLAIIFLASGDLDELKRYLAIAKCDFRDVLFWAEYPDEAKINTPRKRKDAAKLFEALGLQVPDELKDP